MNVHPQVYDRISNMTYAQARRYLRNWGFSHGEQDEIIRKSEPLLTDKDGHWLTRALNKFSSASINGDAADS